MSRISPAVPPYPESIQTRLDTLMPSGVEPLWLFRVMARDERLFSRSIGSGLLDRGHLTLREREIVILRVCANNRSQYEWGVHVTAFSERAGLTPEQVAATADKHASAPCWGERDQLLLRLCDALQEGTTLTDALWNQLAAAFTAEKILELLLLNGFYRTICILTNSLQMPLEPFAARFPETTAA
jgi:alkylhydroperoxidase family enzyme